MATITSTIKTNAVFDWIFRESNIGENSIGQATHERQGAPEKKQFVVAKNLHHGHSVGNQCVVVEWAQ